MYQIDSQFEHPAVALTEFALQPHPCSISGLQAAPSGGLQTAQFRQSMAPLATSRSEAWGVGLFCVLWITLRRPTKFDEPAEGSLKALTCVSKREIITSARR
jgi:hypothetical protein